MHGNHRIIVHNVRLRYDFVIKRNITIIQGDSGTGKTTLISLLRLRDNLGDGSGVDVICDVPCTILEGNRWKSQLTEIENSIVFIDEENAFIRSEDFAKAVQKSSNYYVLITREGLPNLPYSVEEIYGMHSSGKYQGTRQTYQTLYHIYPVAETLPLPAPDIFLTEDSNSGFQFFSAISDPNHNTCVHANGKSNLYRKLSELQGTIIVIADGAAIGSEMNLLSEYVHQNNDVHLFLPESFEWLILRSGVIDGQHVQEILDAPEDYIESQTYFSWEQFFTALLINETKDSYLHYQKKRLNPAYLHAKNCSAITDLIPWNIPS